MNGIYTAPLAHLATPYPAPGPAPAPVVQEQPATPAEVVTLSGTVQSTEAPENRLVLTANGKKAIGFTTAVGTVFWGGFGTLLGHALGNPLIGGLVGLGLGLLSGVGAGFKMREEAQESVRNNGTGTPFFRIDTEAEPQPMTLKQVLQEMSRTDP